MSLGGPESMNIEQCVPTVNFIVVNYDYNHNETARRQESMNKIMNNVRRLVP